MIRRLPLLKLTDLSESQRELYKAITGEWHWNRPNSDNGELDGPYNAWLYAPEVGRLCSSFALGLRDAVTLSDRVRELAILTVATHPFSPFIWHAHVGRARTSGLSDEQIETIRLEGVLELTDPTEAVVAQATRAIVTERDLSDELYERAMDLLGPQGMVELLEVCSWYQSLALQCQVFRVPPRAE